jgi:DNA-binding NarL/FixJ family response regulator
MHFSPSTRAAAADHGASPRSARRSAVIVDEQPLWLDALEGVLKRTGFQTTGRVRTPTAALALVEEQTPDVLVVSITVADGGLDATDLVRRARAERPGLAVVVLTPSDDPRVIASAFDAGAAVCCVKTAELEDVAYAIRQIFDRSVFYASPVTPAVTEPGVEDSMRRLTKRELQILRLAAEGYSNAALARMLWVTEQTIKFHLSNVYRKIQVSNRTEASAWAQRHGLLGPDASSPAA